MVRTQIQLPEEQLATLRKLAVSEGRSVSDLVREGVEALVHNRGEREGAKERSLAAVGRFRSGARDLSRSHDRHLVAAFGE